MPRLKSTNFAVTQLAANMTATDKTFTVTDASKFPNTGPFVVLIYNTTGSTLVREIVEVGSIDKTTNTFGNVLRGIEGTTKAAHSAGDNVELVWTSGSYQRLADEDYTDILDKKIQLVADEPFSFSGTLTANGWTGTSAPFIQTVTVFGLSGIGSMPTVDVVLSANWETAVSERDSWSHIKKIDFADNSLTFYSDTKPTIQLTFSGVQAVRRARIRNVWIVGANAPASAARVTSQLYNGRIYCPQSGGTAMHIYDIASDTWIVGANAPASALRFTSQLYNGRIYCPQSDGTAMHIYDIASDTWIVGANAPASASRYTSQLYNGRIYCPQNDGTAMHTYDIASDTWIVGANAPASAARVTSQLYNGRIYCPQSGGTAMHIYDIASDTWIVGANAPASALRYTSQLYNGRIYCPQNDGTAMHIYDIASDTWIVGANALIWMSQSTSALYKDKLYVTSWDTLQVYDISSNSWILGAAPTQAYRRTSQLYNGKIYCIRDNDAILDIYG